MKCFALVGPNSHLHLNILVLDLLLNVLPRKNEEGPLLVFPHMLLEEIIDVNGIFGCAVIQYSKTQVIHLKLICTSGLWQLHPFMGDAANRKPCLAQHPSVVMHGCL